MANTTRTSRVMCACGNATTAEVTAGKVIVPPDSGKAIIITGGWMRALGGNAATATSVDIKDTTGTPVVGVAIAVAALTDGAVIHFNTATTVTRTTYGVAHTKGKGLQIKDTGSGLATATSVDYCVFYTKV